MSNNFPPIEGDERANSKHDRFERASHQSAAGGVPGVEENDDDQDPPEYREADGGTSQYDKANQTINYELNEINKKIVKAQGQIKDITVAVLINQRALVDQELTEDHKQEIINLVSACTGLDTKVVEVMATDFDTRIEDLSLEGERGLLGDIPMWAIGIYRWL